MPGPAGHEPVMTAEVLEYLAVRPDGIYLDATLGMGGHAGAIARRLKTGLVIANDRDAESIERARRNTAEWAHVMVYTQFEFSRLDEALPGGEKVDGLVADLGVNFPQLTEPARGFSLFADGPLDMRMDRSKGVTAEELVNRSTEQELADLIFGLAGERRSRRIARQIVRARPIRSTRHLADVVGTAAPRTGHLHPATKTFMALRMAVNDEPGELDGLLERGPGMVKPGGRMVVISFMSAEDRKVKERFRELARAGRGTILTKRPVTPGDEEVERNRAARSGKLRALEIR